MSTREINELTPVPTLDTTAQFEIEQSGNSFRTNLADMLALQTSNLSGLTIDANKDWLGFDITNLGNLGVTGFIDLAEIAAPANPAVNTGRLYVQDVASTTTLFFRDSFGTATNLLSPGEVFTWSANHDANTFALVNPRFADDVDPTKRVILDISGNAISTNLTITTNQTSSQVLNVPNITGFDEVVTENFTQTLANKTLTTPTIADFTNATHNHETAAEGGQLDSTLALLDTATIAYLNTTNAYVAGNRQDFLGSTGGTAGLNVGGIAGNPLTQVDGDIWLNTSTNQLFARVNGVDLDIGSTGISPPFSDNISIVEGSADPTKELRFEVDGNTTAIIGVIATIFTTAKTITIPDATDTLVGKNTTDTFTNKIFNVDAAGNQLTQTTPSAGQYLRDDGTEFIASNILAGDLPATVVQTNQANTFGDFAQSFADDQLFIRNPADSFAYQIIGDAIVANRTVTLPLLTTNDIFVTEAHAQTLLNKTLGAGTVISAIPTINDGIKITFNPDDTNAGLNTGQNTSEPSSPVNGDIFYDSSAGLFKGRENGVWVGLGPTEIFTWTANHNAAGFDLLNVGGITINNPLDTFQYIITPAAIVANRIVNLPLLTGTDTLVTEAHSQTLTNKTITLGNNSISGTFAEFNTAVTDATLVDLDDAQTLTNKTINLSNNTISGTFAEFNTAVTDATLVSLENVQTITGAKTFADNALLIQNPLETFEYLIQGGAIVADRTASLPVLIGNDTFVFEAHIQTLTNKVITLGGNTISGTFAEFNTAVTDATLVDLDDAQTLTNKTIDAASNTITNIGASEIEPGIINDQTAIPALEGVDTLLIYDDSLAALRKISLAEISPITVFTVSMDTLTAMNNDFHPISAHVDVASGTELNIQSPLASAGILERMAVQINANGQAGITIWKIRINGVDGNQTISIPASTTGFFQDVTNTDTIAVGDLVCYQNTGIAGGAYQLQGSSMVMLVT